MPRTRTVEEVRMFLGEVTYYTRCIPHCSTITSPLRSLTRKNAKFIWSSQCEKSFKTIKHEIASERVLVPYDPRYPLQLACDASPTGIAGVLSHIIDDQERPIAFASKSLKNAEKNYSQIDREALEIMFAVDYFYHYLFGRSLKLITDNQPLLRIFHQNSNKRYAVFLSAFNYEVVYKKGIENANADCL